MQRQKIHQFWAIFEPQYLGNAPSKRVGFFYLYNWNKTQKGVKETMMKLFLLRLFNVEF